MKKIIYPILLLSLFLFGWELYAHSGFISTRILPPPSSILEATLANQDILLTHATQTLLESLIGLGIAVVLGILLAVLIFLSPALKKSLYPLLVLSQTIPIIALAPLLLIWFGFGIMPKIIIVALYCFFPITIAVSDGLTHTDQQIVDLLKSMKATKWQILTFAHFPSALPAFFSGLRIAATYTITGAIVGEYVGAYRGLGIYMQTAARSHAIVLVFSSIMITAVLSIILVGLVSVLERVSIPWKINDDK